MAEFWDGKILLVLPEDPKYAVKKVRVHMSSSDIFSVFQEMCVTLKWNFNIERKTSLCIR